MRGALDLEAGLQGTLEDPTGTARVVADELRVRGEDLGSVTVDANVAGQQAHVQARSDKFRIDADGTARHRRTLPDQTCMCWSTISTSPRCRSTLDPPLTGRVRAGSTERQSFESSRRHATTTIEEMIVTWNGQPIATDGPATIRYANRQFAIDRVRRTCAGLDGGRARHAACRSAIGRGRGQSRRAVEPLDACFVRTGTVRRQGARSRVPSRARSEVPCARSIPTSSCRSNRDCDRLRC